MRPFGSPAHRGSPLNAQGHGNLSQALRRRPGRHRRHVRRAGRDRAPGGMTVENSGPPTGSCPRPPPGRAVRHDQARAARRLARHDLPRDGHDHRRPTRACARRPSRRHIVPGERAVCLDGYLATYTRPLTAGAPTFTVPTLPGVRSPMLLTDAELVPRREWATVKTHACGVLGKLGLRDQVQAVAFGYENGLAPGHPALSNLQGRGQGRGMTADRGCGRGRTASPSGGTRVGS